MGRHIRMYWICGVERRDWGTSHMAMANVADRLGMTEVGTALEEAITGQLSVDAGPAAPRPGSLGSESPTQLHAVTPESSKLHAVTPKSSKLPLPVTLPGILLCPD